MSLKNLLKTKKGADKILSVYWFAVLFIVASAIVYMVFIFYGKPYDVRDLEERALINKIADCISEGGYIREDFFSSQENFLENCKLNFNTEDFSDWDNNYQYYAEIKLYEFDENIVNNLQGKSIFEISVGNSALKPSAVSIIGKKYAKNTIVIHYTAGGVATSDVEASLKNDGLSVHYIIDRQGNIAECELEGTQIIQCPIKTISEIEGLWEQNLAYHAGCGVGEDELPVCSTECVNEEGLLAEECNVFAEDSSLCCIKGFNQKSVGIELINLGTLCGQSCQDKGEGVEIGNKIWQTYTEEQLSSLAILIKEIANRNNIPLDRNHIIGHHEITNNKQDPGLAFPWEELMGTLNILEDNEITSSNEELDLDYGRVFYALDKSNNPYLVKILVGVGKNEKNE